MGSAAGGKKKEKKERKEEEEEEGRRREKEMKDKWAGLVAGASRLPLAAGGESN